MEEEIVPNGKVPNDWKSFLRNSKNKTDLFELLAESIYGVETGIAYATIVNSTICKKNN